MRWKVRQQQWQVDAISYKYLMRGDILSAIRTWRAMLRQLLMTPPQRVRASFQRA